VFKAKRQRLMSKPLCCLLFFETHKHIGEMLTLAPAPVQEPFGLSVSNLKQCLIAGVFVIMERTGAANEDPFENQITDVPLTARCNTIERDLREMLGERELPAKLEQFAFFWINLAAFQGQGREIGFKLLKR
jgi:putative membrane protein